MADLPESTGSEPGYRRPVVIVQDDDFNRSQIRTVICVALTSNLKLAEVSGNVFLRSAETGLPKDSVGNVSQVITLDKNMPTERVGMLSDDLLSEVLDGIQFMIGRL